MAFCRECGKRFNDEELSRRGLCLACRMARVEECVRQMINRNGPIYDRYRRGLSRAREGLKKVKV